MNFISDNKGFSIVELIVVGAVVAMLAMVGWIYIKGEKSSTSEAQPNKVNTQANKQLDNSQSGIRFTFTAPSGYTSIDNDLSKKRIKISIPDNHYSRITFSTNQEDVIDFSTLRQCADINLETDPDPYPCIIKDAQAHQISTIDDKTVNFETLAFGPFDAKYTVAQTKSQPFFQVKGSALTEELREDFSTTVKSISFVE